MSSLGSGGLRARLAGSDEYTLGKCLRDGPLSEIWTAARSADGQQVVLKAYPEDRDQAPSQMQIQAECDALRAVAGTGTPAALDLLPENPAVLVMARAAGVPLSEWIAQAPRLEATAFLEIAAQLAEILTRVHAGRIIHRDVSPANILVEPDTLRIHLIDFGIAQPLGSVARRAAPGQPREFAGTPQYMAPEQTGWLNRGCDARSDLYALGATLYSLLTGQPPFEGSTLVELIHAHIARLPTDPGQLRSGVPDAFSRIVLRLMRKEPEERYQSARALHADLQRLREQLTLRGSIEGFELGAAEAPERPRFAPRLHGRQAQRETLERLYARAGEGLLQAVLIRGVPGVGKSALVDALRPRIVETRGHLALGKFELAHERPYSAWAEALESLVQKLLMESDARLRRWREELREGLGNIAQALVEVVPDLRLVLGDVPAVPALGPSETQARLALALQRFLRVCARPERPLAIFLDDLQWSDAGSRFLLEEILSGDRSAALLLIVAQRSDEASGAALEPLLGRLAERGVGLEILDLPPLDSAATVELLAEGLCRTPEAVQALAALIERKTGNVPLLVREFVEHIRERGLLRHEPGLGWSWDPARIAAADIPDGAVALMTARMDRLGAPARKLVELASCLSSEFSVDLLCELGGAPRSELVQHLYDLCDAGLLAPCSGGFRFAHDRIREAAQSRLSDAERARIHADTARWLLARTPEAERTQRVFEIVDHLNQGLSLLGEAERPNAIRLNFLAGKQALATGAADTAAGYLDVARQAFREEDWSADPQLGFELHLLCAECAFQCGTFDRALALLDALDRRPQSLMEFSRVATQRSRVLSLTREPEESVRYTLEVLGKLGIHWPLHPSRLRAYLEMYRVQRRVRRLRVEDFMKPASRLDPTWLAPLHIVSAGGAALGRVDFHLVALANCLVMRTQLRHGALPRAGFTLAAFASFTHRILGDGESARRYASIALEWIQRFPDPRTDLRTECQIHSALNPWLMPRRKALAPLLRVADAAGEIGDPEFTNYARFLASNLLALGGEPLALAQQRLREQAESIARSGHRFSEPAECLAALRWLTEPGSDTLERALAATEARLASGSRAAEPYARTIWMMVLCIHGRFDLALAQSDALGERLFRVVPYVHVVDHTFYRGLASAALAREAQGRSRRRLCREMRRSARRLRGWARHGPDFVHMKLHLEAELAGLQRDGKRGRLLLERAAQSALEQSFTQHAALAHERRARLLLDLRRETEARAAFAQAIALYRAWGAELKATALEQLQG